MKYHLIICPFYLIQMLCGRAQLFLTNPRIRPVVLRELCQEIAPVVALIFQTSFDSGIVPTDWKKAQVCPLFKKGNKTDPANNRPI